MIERLFYLGATHKTAALAVRERLAVGPERVQRLLSELRRVAAEALVLSTCGRFEIYLIVSPSRQKNWAAWLGPILSQSSSSLQENLSVRTGADAATHALRVAAGLESRIVGEDQVLGQVRRAFDLATRHRAIGPVLSTLFRTAIHTGRRVRTETTLGRHGRCFARLAVKIVRDALDRRPARSPSEEVRRVGTAHQVRSVCVDAAPVQSILILGTGCLARDVAEELWRSARNARLRFVSHHLGRAQQLAAEFHGEGYGLDALPRLLSNSDAVIACAAATRPLIEWTMLARRTAPLTIIDLGVPRNVDPAVAAMPGITLHDLESLSPTGETPNEDTTAAARIVDEEMRRFTDWLRGRAAAPRISRLLQSVRAAADPPSRALRRKLHERIVHLKQEAAA